jgi:predicted esterase
MILVHGRGASAEKILPVGLELRLDDVAFVAPNAGGSTWYPQSFLAPIEQNEPGISSGLRMLSRLVESLEEQGVDAARIGLLGFSQGACLTLEFAARNARRYAGVFGLSGGLIGPPATPRDYPGSFAGTPIFLGCSDIDAHVPLARVHESTEVLRRMGAIVDERIYPGMGHLVNEDEINAVRAILSA